jgi:hypothetical protein
MVTYNKEHLKKLYPTIEELNKAIDNTESEIYTYEQYNTYESKLKVKRLKIFLSNLRSVKNGN